MNSTLDMIGQRIFVGDRVVWIDPDDGTSAYQVGRISAIDEFRRVSLDVEEVSYLGLNPRVSADEVIATRSQPPAGAPAGRH